MLNDRDDKHQGLEDGEYHFSDEEVNYEADTSPKSTDPTGAVPKPTAGDMMSRLSGSKRMLISLVVFIALVFVVYKMIAPVSQQAPSTEFAATTSAGAPPKTLTPPAQPVVSVAPPPIATTPQVTIVTRPVPAAQPQQPVMMPPQQPAIAQPQQPVMPQPQQPGMMPPQQPAIAQPQQPVMAQPQQPGMMPSQQPAMMPPQQPAMAQPQQPVMTQPQQQVVQLPQVTTTVTTTTPDMNAYTNQGQQEVNQVQQAVPNGLGQPSQIDKQINAIAVQNEQRFNQLQNDYVNGINRYNEQNKNLGQQVQTLTERVGALETEINQLTQQLIRARTDDKVSMNTTRPVAPREPIPQAAVSAKIPYNVQAIIPGRAWLRSETGDTVTVAEGDMIRGVGRVAKIDPYDGVVQIAMGGRIVSLSYGNGD